MKQFYPKRSGFAIWGPVWSLGAKSGRDEFGDFQSFVIGAPALFQPNEPRRVRIFVQWYRPTFIPQPKQVLQCYGAIAWTEMESFGSKRDRLKIVLRTFGDWVSVIESGAPSIGDLRNQEWEAIIGSQTTIQ